MKILHGPVNIANQPWSLSRYERLHGCKSDLVVNYNTKFNFDYDRCLSEYRKVSLKSIIKRFLWGISIPFRYDVVHYYFGRSFLYWDDYSAIYHKLAFLDMKLAKKMGCKIIMTLQGCDARIAKLSDKNTLYTPCRDGYCGSYQYCATIYDLQKLNTLNRIFPFIDKVFILNPELANFIPNAEFLPYSSVDVEKMELHPPKNTGKIRILHAPSDPLVKGTKYILNAIESLSTRYDIEFILVQNIPYKQALELYKTADLVIDQLLCGWYGGFAVELMAMGKPVMCYIREEDLKFIPPEMHNDLPILRTTPDSIERDLEVIISNRQVLPEAGMRSRNFAEKWHNPRKIAKAMLSIYKNPKVRFKMYPEE